MPEHVMRLHGSDLSRGTGPAMQSFLSLVTRGTEGAVRMAIEGRSVGRGTLPKWLRAGSRYDIRKYSNRTHEIVLSAPPLREVLPHEDDQRILPSQFDPNQSGLDLFESALRDGIRAQTDSDKLDGHWAEEISSGIHELLAQGVDYLEIGNQSALRIQASDAEQLRTLSRQVPPKQSAKVVGKLEAIRHSNRAFVLQIDTGELLRGIAEGIEPDRLASMFGKRALISGFAVFRPNKHLLRIEADDIRLAETKDEIFVGTPLPLFPDIELQALRVSQGPRSGLAAIIGQWPGDESEEEINVALGTLR